MTDDYRGVHAAVLGATGFIGRWVARGLCARGARVSLLARDPGGAARLCAEHGIQGDIHAVDLEDEESLLNALGGLRPSIVFNLAGYGVDHGEQDAGAAYRLNVRLVDKLCAAAETRGPDWGGQSLVHAGSALEYGEAGGDLSEDGLERPTTMYGRTKLAGTRRLVEYCGRTGLRAIAVRLFTVYGPGEHAGRLLPSLMKAAGTDEVLPLTGGAQKRDFTYVADVAEGLLRLGRTGAAPGEVINLGTGHLTEVREFAETAASILGIPKARLGFGMRRPRFPEMEHSAVALERLDRLAGWRPRTTIAEGIEKTVGWSESSWKGGNRQYARVQ